MASQQSSRVEPLSPELPSAVGAFPDTPVPQQSPLDDVKPPLSPSRQDSPAIEIEKALDETSSQSSPIDEETIDEESPRPLKEKGPSALEDHNDKTSPQFSPVDEKAHLPPSADAPSAFQRLPDEIIQQVLEVTDPDSFASLVLLNTKWRRISQQAHLYAHHLSKCNSYAAGHASISDESVNDDNLPNLRRLFAREVKRNLFEAYLRPKTTTIKLISTSISSSSAPGGEGLQFSPSPRGHHVLAYNSSRIYILDVREPELAVKRELKILRRPAAACILDDGSLLAILSTDMQVDLYDLGPSPPRRTQSLILDMAPRAIALSPCGSVMAAAYEGGIEVSSIHPGALETDRRAVKCDAVDSLAFSLDGTQLLGTTTNSSTPNTVILTAPYYDPGNQMSDDNISALWTTSILFPNTSRDCSHAVLLQESSSVEAMWTFTYDRSFETFRAVRIDDLRNGTTYFTGPIPTAASPGPLLPSTLPAASFQGELVSAGFEGQDVWLYGVPEDLEAVPEVNSSSADPSAPPALHRRGSGVSVRSPSRIQEANGCRVPQWQILCDKYRNTFVTGRKITELCGVSNVKWVAGFGNTSLQERLVVTARGVMPTKPITEEDGIDFVDGGRVTILDFDYNPDNGQEQDITIEVGTMEPEILEEEHRDIDTEVAIVRRRTVAQRRGNRGGMMRSATRSTHQLEALLRPATSHGPEIEDPLVPRPMATARNTVRADTPEEAEDATLEEAQEALDAPYAHASPRSGTTLRRAATAAAVSRQRQPQTPVAGPVEYRRADGRAEHPHESDADNWVPPPPPYAKEDPGVDLPVFLRHSAIPGVRVVPTNRQTIAGIPPVPPVPAIPSFPPVPPIPHGMPPSSTGRPELPRIRTSSAREGHQRNTWVPGTASQRAASDSVSGRPTVPAMGALHRPTSSYPTQMGTRSLPDDEEDIYDVSPVGSPPQAAEPQESRAHVTTASASTPERPSAGALSSASEYTPASSMSHAPTEASFSDSVNMHAYHPIIPLSATSVQRPEDPRSASPVVGKLPNAQTWPRAPHAPAPASAAPLAGYPHSAPATNLNNGTAIGAALPPAPKPEQLASLHRREGSFGAPRPASGSFQFARVPVGSRSNQTRVSRRYSGIPEVRPPSPPDQPLIISTPTGVAGAFDNPGQSHIVSHHVGPVIHAPVPRHIRPVSSIHVLRPTMDCLETTSSIGPEGASSNHPILLNVPPAPPSGPLTSSSLRHHTSLSRRPSRARKGALKNIHDARTRGWTGRKKNKKKGNGNDGASAADWTEVNMGAKAPKPQTKERKCIVM
ncbi:Uu.00g044400.m01.CDS01 [Anthostomella pinea]|uniref:Uu.00g044400.m01.CDS01 n=1 Tax=Anthostomella pinea TaxID=933095 RepID=A0AAI8YEB6_9PEZI|nr:Uu.00g044400.m01.CDS01 [Anthostomella pinea]